MRYRFLVAGLAVTVSCMPPGISRSNRERALAVRTVAGKTQPLTLVSTDALLCNVDAITYGKTQAGDAIFCNWYRGDGQVWRDKNGVGAKSGSASHDAQPVQPKAGESTANKLRSSGTKKIKN